MGIRGLVAEERLDVAERRRTGAKHVRVLYGVDELVQLRRVEAANCAIQANTHRQARRRRAGRSERRARAVAELPVAVRDRVAFGHDACERLVRVHLQDRVRVVGRVRGEVRNRVAHHVQRLVGAAAVHDAAEDSARHACEDRRLYPLIGGRRHGRKGRRVSGNRGPSRVVALPAAAQTDIVRVAEIGRNRDAAAAIRDVVPHQPARLRHVDGLHDEEGGDVVNLAVLVSRRQPDVGDEDVVRVFGIQFTERAPGDRLVRDILAGEGRRRINDDPGDLCMRLRDRHEHCDDRCGGECRSTEQCGDAVQHYGTPLVV